MKKILITSPTYYEIKPFILNHFINYKDKDNLKTYSGKIRAVYCDILITGIGISATVYNLTKVLAKNRYDIVLNAGIAGSNNKKFKPGSVVEVIQDEFADFGVLKKHVFFSADKYQTFDNHLINSNILINKKPVTVLSKAIGRTIHTLDYEGINVKSDRYYDIETMEGAAFFFVCQNEKVKYTALRAISNTIGISDKTQWKTAEAINNLCIELYHVIESL